MWKLKDQASPQRWAKEEAKFSISNSRIEGSTLSKS
jgi:hypothetical protein